MLKNVALPPINSSSPHPTAFYIQLLLVMLQWFTSWDGLSSAWHTPSESTSWAKTLSSTNRFLVVKVIYTLFDKSSMRRDSEEMEDMSNPPTVNRRSIYILTRSVYYIPSTNRVMLDRTMRQVDHFGSMPKSY